MTSISKFSWDYGEPKEENVNYLVALNYEGGYEIGYWSYGKWWSKDGFEIENALAWSPLPKHPHDDNILIGRNS